MKIKILCVKNKITVLILCVACTLLIFVSGCKKNSYSEKIDFSNIENLYEQPLPVIQKAVLGKWQWVNIARDGFIGTIKPIDTFVEITENNVVITQIGDAAWIDKKIYMKSFSYVWKKKKTDSGLTYVMWDSENNKGWYFYKILNDELSVLCDDVTIFNGDVYKFIKIK